MIGDIRGRWGTILEIKAGVLAIVVFQRRVLGEWVGGRGGNFG